jgi:hypothetical protein
MDVSLAMMMIGWTVLDLLIHGAYGAPNPNVGHSGWAAAYALGFSVVNFVLAVLGRRFVFNHNLGAIFDESPAHYRWKMWPGPDR